MPEIDSETRQRLRRTLRWALRAEPWRPTGSKGVTRPWYDRRLECLLAYGLVRSRMPLRILKLLRLHFDKGIPLDKLAFEYRISPRQAARELNQGLDIIIDNVPGDTIVSLCPEVYQWLLQSCPKCGGDLYWDTEGVYGGDGEYCCLLCGDRYTIRELEDCQLLKPPGPLPPNEKI